MLRRPRKIPRSDLQTITPPPFWQGFGGKFLGMQPDMIVVAEGH